MDGGFFFRARPCECARLVHYPLLWFTDTNSLLCTTCTECAHEEFWKDKKQFLLREHSDDYKCCDETHNKAIRKFKDPSNINLITELLNYWDLKCTAIWWIMKTMVQKHLKRQKTILKRYLKRLQNFRKMLIIYNIVNKRKQQNPYLCQ